MSFYKVPNSSRRITNFVRNEAYKWLQEKIKKGEYCVRKGKAARSLQNEIKDDGFTKSSYNEFLEYFEKNPYYYAMQPEKRQPANMIYTSDIRNYFVEYANEILPIGFIIEFFEDDYETKEEITKLMEGFLNFSQTEFESDYSSQVSAKENEIDDIDENLACAYRTRPSILITGLISVAFAVAMIWLGLYFLSQVEFFAVVGEFFGTAHFDWYENIDIGQEKEIVAYISNSANYLVSGEFDMADYIYVYGVRCALVLAGLITGVIFVLVNIYFTVIKLINRITILSYSSMVAKLRNVGAAGILAQAGNITVENDYICKFEKKFIKQYGKSLRRLKKYDDVYEGRVYHLEKLRSSFEKFVNGGNFRRMGLYYTANRGMNGVRWFYLGGTLIIAAAMTFVIPEVQTFVFDLLNI